MHFYEGSNPSPAAIKSIEIVVISMLFLLLFWKKRLHKQLHRKKRDLFPHSQIATKRKSDSRIRRPQGRFFHSSMVMQWLRSIMPSISSSRSSIMLVP